MHMHRPRPGYKYTGLSHHSQRRAPCMPIWSLVTLPLSPPPLGLLTAMAVSYIAELTELNRARKVDKSNRYP